VSKRDIAEITDDAIAELRMAEPHVVKAINLLLNAGVPEHVDTGMASALWRAVRVRQNAEAAHLHVTDYTGS